MNNAMEVANWQQVALVEELEIKGRLLCRVHGRKIVLFQTPQGVFACANQCPHEGYPLSEGSLDDACVLTCNWHNWKFDLATGTNLYGGDRLRTYPVERRGDALWLDIAEAPAAQRRSDCLHSLRDAFDDNDYERIARELARYIRLEGDALEPLRAAIQWSCDRLEYGWTHAYAGMADWLQLRDSVAGDAERELVCLLESMGHLADDVLREKTYPYATAMLPWDESAFLAAVEAQDEQGAIGYLRGALQSGLDFAGLEPALTAAALAHYNSFGHSLIYTVKAGELIARLGPGVSEPLLLPLVRGLVYATREDLIPEFRGYAAALAHWGNNECAAAAPLASNWRKQGIDASLELALEYSAGAIPALYQALLGANLNSMLAFDLERAERRHAPVSANVGWLDFTHGITFANAVRRQCTKYPQLWPQGLLQMALFNGRNAAFTLRDFDPSPWQVEDATSFVRHTRDSLFEHGIGEYIVSVHHLKTTLAIEDEIAAGAPHEVVQLMCAALNRFLQSPLRRRHPQRTAFQSIGFVEHE